MDIRRQTRILTLVCIKPGTLGRLGLYLQGKHTDAIAHLFRQTGFWEEVCKDPFSRAEWLEAVRMAPSIKEDFYTVLSVRDRLPEIERMLDQDPLLRDCFTA